MGQRWIQIGIVGRPQGLRGAFFVSQRDRVLPTQLKLVKIGKDLSNIREYPVQSQFNSGDKPVLLLSHCKDRDAAEAMKGLLVWCQRDEIEVDDDEEYLWADLLGKVVCDSQEQVFGTIREVQNYGASDIVRIESPEGRWVEIPFVDQYFSMDFHHDDAQIFLLVPRETFDDTWTDK